MGRAMSRASTSDAKPAHPDAPARATAALPEAGRLPATDPCGHFGLGIARDGTWYYHGSPIGRKAIAKLFARVLRREDDGSYWLVTPAERGRIDVEDAPFVAVALDVRQAEGRQQLVFTTNLDDEVVAGPEHRLWLEPPPAGAAEGEGGAPYLHVRRGLNARLTPAVWYQLAELAVTEETPEGPKLGVWSDGVFFPLAEAE
jgi:hypothetical protein